MPYISLNPATNTTLKTYGSWDSHHLADALQEAFQAQHGWSRMSFAERVELMNRAAVLFHERVDEYAWLMAVEMGKPLREGRAEVEKCALA
jgi:succinate-semialdehyde dehydrogenase/glutarate-semialdehyde dehydrogenase